MADTAAARHSARMAPRCCRRSRSTATISRSRTTRASSATARAGRRFTPFWRTGASRCASSATDPFGDTPSDDLSRTKLDVIAEGRRCPRRRRDPERDRGLRAGARARGAALPQGQGLGRHRAHRDGRRLSRKPHRRARDRARRPHPQGGRHQGRPGADPQRSRTRPR